MATYAIGDVQGCLEPLLCLLEQCEFDQARDTLWFAGDLVNRGPQSLEVLRFVRSLGNRAVTVLGNHDLHLLAVARGHRPRSPKDTLDAVLDAPDAVELLDWLRTRKMMHFDEHAGYVMVHAGIPPCWPLPLALQLAQEVEQRLRDERIDAFFEHMYGNSPDTWSEDLGGAARLRVITNYMTRMRFCSAVGKLDLDTKEGAASAPPGFDAWFHFENPSLAGIHVVFGHWAALEGHSGQPGYHALDTGCVWGSRLRAMRLEDQRLYHCDC